MSPLISEITEADQAKSRKISPMEKVDRVRSEPKRGRDVIRRAALLSYLVMTLILLLSVSSTRSLQTLTTATMCEQQLPVRLLPPIHPYSWPFEENDGFAPVNETVTSDSVIRSHRQFYDLTESVPFVFVITPTYRRPTQMADMIRLGQTLRNDKAIYWLVIEDQDHPSARIRALLERTGLPFAHLAIHQEFMADGNKPNGRGIFQRNKALEVVEKLETGGVIFFADDDNAFDVRIFPQMRKVKRVGLSGVGFSAGMYERCLVDEKSGNITSFVTAWLGGRKFPVDMAGFGVHTDVLKEKHPRFRGDGPIGHLENQFLESVAKDFGELEPLDNCTKIYAWHVKSIAPTNLDVKDELSKNLTSTI